MRVGWGAALVLLWGCAAGEMGSGASLSHAPVDPALELFAGLEGPGSACFAMRPGRLGARARGIAGQTFLEPAWLVDPALDVAVAVGTMTEDGARGVIRLRGPRRFSRQVARQHLGEGIRARATGGGAIEIAWGAPLTEAERTSASDAGRRCASLVQAHPNAILTHSAPADATHYAFVDAIVYADREGMTAVRVGFTAPTFGERSPPPPDLLGWPRGDDRETLVWAGDGRSLRAERRVSWRELMLRQAERATLEAAPDGGEEVAAPRQLAYADLDPRDLDRTLTIATSWVEGDDGGTPPPDALMRILDEALALYPMEQRLRALVWRGHTLRNEHGVALGIATDAADHYPSDPAFFERLRAYSQAQHERLSRAH